MNVNKAIEWRFYLGLKTKDGADVNREKYRIAAAAALGNLGLNGFTTYETQGYWEGVPEPSMVLEVIDGSARLGYMQAEGLAELLRHQGNQNVVLVTRREMNLGFVASV